MFSNFEFENASRFRARFKISSDIASFVDARLGSPTAYLYTVGLAIGIAWTTIEAAEKLVGRKQIAIQDVALESALLAGRFDALVSLVNSTNPKPKADPVPISDVRELAFQIRNLMFHGSFTPGGSGLVSPVSNRKLLSRLPQVLMTASDDAFGDWVEKRIRQ